MRLKMLITASLAATAFVAPAAANAAGAEIGVRYYKDGTLADGGTLDAGSTDLGAEFEFFLIIDSSGDASLDIGTITVPAGFTIVNDPSNTSVASGATASLRLRCNATSVGTASGTLSIPSNAAGSPFEATLSCETVDTNGDPGMVVRTDDGVSVPDGSGEVEVLTGEGVLLWVYNEGGVVHSLDLQGAETTSALTVNDYYVATNVIAYEGIPVYFGVSCVDKDTDADLLGSFEVSIPVNSWEDYYTFTVHCVTELTDDSGSGAGIPATGSSSTTPLVLLALGLVGLGLGARTVARRRA